MRGTPCAPHHAYHVLPTMRGSQSWESEIDSMHACRVQGCAAWQGHAAAPCLMVTQELVARKRHMPPHTCMHTDCAHTQAAQALGVRYVNVQGDSELIVRQLTGRYKASEKGGLAQLLAEAKGLLEAFHGFSVKHVYR